MRTKRAPAWFIRVLALGVVGANKGILHNAGKNGCGMAGVQYVVREGEDILSGAMVSSTCRSSPCTDEAYFTGVGWARRYYFLRTGLPGDGVHLVTSCENKRSQTVRVGSNAADATWYGVAVAA